jgi:hypothetical protein
MTVVRPKGYPFLHCPGEHGCLMECAVSTDVAGYHKSAQSNPLTTIFEGPERGLICSHGSLTIGLTVYLGRGTLKGLISVLSVISHQHQKMDCCFVH